MSEERKFALLPESKLRGLLSPSQHRTEVIHKSSVAFTSGVSGHYSASDGGTKSVTEDYYKKPTY